MQRFHRRISLFIIDEAHHAAAPSYRAIVDAILAQRPEAMVVGFTATPNRGDGVRLVDVFEKIVYSMDARKAIDSGYLVPVKSYAVATSTNLDDIASRAATSSSVNSRRRSTPSIATHASLPPTNKIRRDSKHWCSRLRSNTRATSPKNSSPTTSRPEWASGETPKDERERIVRDFRNGDLDVLVNCGLYLEGFDVPSVQVILNARPTKSTTLYTQITGRALRPVDEIAHTLSVTDSALMRRELVEKSTKPAALIIDFVDQAQHHQLVTLPSPVRTSAADRRARSDDRASRRKIRRAVTPRSETRREGSLGRRDPHRAARDRRLRGAERNQAHVGTAQPRSLAHDSAAATHRVGQVGPADSELRPAVRQLGHRSQAHRAARRCRTLRTAQCST